MIHCEGGVELLVVSHSEISVGRERPEGEYAFFDRLLDGGDDDGLLFGAEQSAVAAVRVEAEHADAGIVDAEVLLERLFHQAQFAEYLFFGDGSRHLLEGNVASDDAHFQPFADHQHGNVLHPESLLEELRMAGESEAFGDYRLLVDGSCHQHVYLAGLEVAYGPFECGNRGLGGFSGGSARLCVHIVRQASDYVHAPGVSLGCGRNGVGVHLLDFGDGFAVETENLARTVYYGSEHIEDARVAQGLDDDFVTYSVAVTLGNAYYKFIVFHNPNVLSSLT